MESKRKYTAPEVTVVTTRAEKGYAASTTRVAVYLALLNAAPTEGYEAANGWTEGNNVFWN